MREAQLHIPKVALAVANGESTQIDIDLTINADGEFSVHFMPREGGSMTFDAHNWRRLKRAMQQVEDKLAEIEQKGITFRAGGVHTGASLDNPGGFQNE